MKTLLVLFSALLFAACSSNSTSPTQPNTPPDNGNGTKTYAGVCQGNAVYVTAATFTSGTFSKTAKGWRVDGAFLIDTSAITMTICSQDSGAAWQQPYSPSTNKAFWKGDTCLIESLTFKGSCAGDTMYVQTRVLAIQQPSGTVMQIDTLSFYAARKK